MYLIDLCLCWHDDPINLTHCHNATIADLMTYYSNQVKLIQNWRFVKNKKTRSKHFLSYFLITHKGDHAQNHVNVGIHPDGHL